MPLSLPWLGGFPWYAWCSIVPTPSFPFHWFTCSPYFLLPPTPLLRMWCHSLVGTPLSDPGDFLAMVASFHHSQTLGCSCLDLRGPHLAGPLLTSLGFACTRLIPCLLPTMSPLGLLLVHPKPSVLSPSQTHHGYSLCPSSPRCHVFLVTPSRTLSSPSCAVRTPSLSPHFSLPHSRCPSRRR